MRCFLPFSDDLEKSSLRLEQLWHSTNFVIGVYQLSESIHWPLSKAFHKCVQKDWERDASRAQTLQSAQIPRREPEVFRQVVQRRETA